MHLTGRYPEWWQGKRFEKPVRWIAGSESAELTRKGIQRVLLGPPEAKELWGTGMIPKDSIISTTPRQGVADAVASISVRHKNGISSLQLASYDQGRTKWQAETLDGAWFDEEPPLDVYTEGITRTNVSMGPILLTLTPLFGMSAVVMRFLIEHVPGTHATTMTINDVDHYSDEQRAAIIASYPEFERDARTKGIPQLGSGRVFPLNEESLQVEPFRIPTHWPQICGIDFGWDHPSAGVRLAWDRDTDHYYVTAAHRARHQTPGVFALSVKGWGEWLPWSWPHDGLQHDKGSGQELAKQYKTQGLNILEQRATFEDGSFGVEAGVQHMLEYMQAGKFHVFSTLSDWFQEFNLYHRKDGLIVKLNDDLISATRYAIMMRRQAVISPLDPIWGKKSGMADREYDPWSRA